ncbi:MAG: sigma-70 family RNA polymerase sigma factor [Gemmataceae bacterium]|nr:sigma-70 family RNA polymerase sigma factor [Gemmataceae bacterium]
MNSTSTRVSLLMRMRDSQDREAWGEFVQRYAPLIHAYGRHRGLQDADAADLAQEVLRCVARSAAEFRYDPARGSFRGWLYTVTRNELRKMAVRNDRQASGTGESAVRQILEQQPDVATDEAEWTREYQRNLFHWAAAKVRPEFRETSWQAFWRTAVVGHDINAAATELNVTVGAIYIARSRITARIRQEIEAVERE